MFRSPLIAVVLAGLIGVGAFYLGQRWATHAPQNVLYTVDNGRIVPTPEPVGFSREDLEFAAHFWRPLLAEYPADPATLRDTLRQTLEADFEADAAVMEQRLPGLSDRQRLIVYLVLRVGGSIAVYVPRANIPDDLEELVMGQYGNCSDYAMRLLMVLDAFDVGGQMVTIWSPTLPGHVLVNAHDPHDRSGWLLDANYNTFARIADTDGGYFEAMLAHGVEERRQLVHDAGAVPIALPCFVRYAEPGVFIDGPSPMFTPQSIMRSILQKFPQGYRSYWTDEFNVVLRRAKEKPRRRRPWTLQTYPSQAVRSFSARCDLPADRFEQLIDQAISRLPD